METFVNKVAESGLITLDLAEYYPKESDLMVFDLKPFLFMEMILKEKDFREALKQHDWTVYENKHVGVTCTADAIIPVWAYMLLASYLQPVASSVSMISKEKLAGQVLLENIRKIDAFTFADKRVVVKGCGDLPIDEGAYFAITALLKPVAKSVMYGEPCSTVPIFKKKNSE